MNVSMFSYLPSDDDAIPLVRRQLDANERAAALDETAGEGFFSDDDDPNKEKAEHSGDRTTVMDTIIVNSRVNSRQEDIINASQPLQLFSIYLFSILVVTMQTLIL